MIKAENIYMHYPVPKKYIEYMTKPFTMKRFTALHGINLNIETGDRVAFIGANGAGKTTLLKLIGGLLYPTSGHIEVNGQDTVKHNLKARKSVGFILNEERSFYWRLTGIQNLEFFGALDNLKGDELERKINQVIQIVGLQEAADKLFAGYSSGMKQRLAIARGLMTNSNILILDEPTRTLDPIAAEDIKELLKDKIHHDRAKTLLIATHRLDEVEALCNKACIMKKGNIMIFENIDIIIKDYGSLFNCYKKFIEN